PRQPYHAARDRLHDEAAWRANDLRNDAAHVRQRARAVQLEPQHARIEYPLAVGILAGQRSVRGLHRWPRHLRSALGAADEPRSCGQGHAAASLLMLLALPL